VWAGRRVGRALPHIDAGPRVWYTVCPGRRVRAGGDHAGNTLAKGNDD